MLTAVMSVLAEIAFTWGPTSGPSPLTIVPSRDGASVLRT